MSKSRLVVVLFIAIPFLLFPKPTLSEYEHQVTYVAEFSLYELSFDSMMGYDIVRLKDGSWLSDLGKPMLPSIELKIALPTGMAVKKVHVIESRSENVAGKYNIFPAQPPIKMGSSDTNPDFIEPDKVMYTSTQSYPSKLVEFVHQSDLAGQGIAHVIIYPVQYVPAEKRLTLYTSVTIALEGTDGYNCGDYLSPNISDKGRGIYKKMIEDMVVNPEHVQLNTGFKMGRASVLPDGYFDHVIITPASYASYFQPLADWNTRKGIKDTVIAISDILTTYPGFNDQQKIRNFIIDAHSNWGAIYFLLGGENDSIPFEYRTFYEDYTPSDQYYSDYDEDWTHEVFVGRVSVEDTTQINTFVNKVLKYEKDPPRTEYPLDVLLIGMDLDATTHCEFLADSINSYIPSRFNVTKVYDSHGGDHGDSVIYYLNAGQNLVTHLDRGNSISLGTGVWNHGWGIWNYQVVFLVNENELSIVSSIASDANKIDRNDCIAEYFIFTPNAGIAFIGNTRNGLFNPGNPFTLSGKLVWEWWKGLFTRDKYRLGEILVDCKHQFDSWTIFEKHCEWTFNLLGEPAMSIWTDEPDSFAVTFPSTFLKITSTISVHIEDSTTHVPVESAYVCLWKEGEICLTGGYTDANGDVILPPFPATAGILSLYATVTKHNYIPYEQEVEIEITHMCGDPNGDVKVNVSDVIYLINYLFKGDDPPLCLPYPYISCADVNTDTELNVSDVIYLINYLFKGGPAPGC